MEEKRQNKKEKKMLPEQAYEEIVKLARAHALVYQAVGGIVVIVHPETQKKEGIYEKIQWMHGLGPHPKSNICFNK